EGSDWLLGWNTQEFPNGTYWVKVTASDRYGNTDSDSMQVEVENYFDVTGKVGLSDDPPDSSGSVVHVLGVALEDTTDKAGSFLLENVGGGSYLFQIGHPGYIPLDTVVQVLGGSDFQFTLEIGSYILGDANYDQDVNLGDVVYLVNYLFKNGPPPLPYFSGDANSDEIIDIGDVIYLVNYLFRGGPPPGSSR
ncbi:MAG: hypothetical protein WBD64_04305, partial [Candidatus Zixiibacteriota bacterium]